MNALQDHGNIYESLQFARPATQIRLLRLLDYGASPVQQSSLDDAEPLKYELAVHDFRLSLMPDAVSYAWKFFPEFDAISYAWGDPTPKREIYVNGVELRIGETCHYALRQARLQDAEYIWIDAICVNQQDLKEKGHQVAMMFSIFRRARRVLACIGLADDASDRILAILPSCSSRKARTSQDVRSAKGELHPLWRNELPNVLWQNWHSVDISEPTTDWREWVFVHRPCNCTNKDSSRNGHAEFRVQFCEDFNALFQRPYFQRLWVAQELYAGGVDCLFLVGRSSFSLLNIKDLHMAALRTFNDLHEQQCDKPAIFMLEMLRIQAEGGSMMHLRLASSLLCSDPRDRVYGTLGFYQYGSDSSKPWLDSIVPDYNKSAFDLALVLAKPGSCRSGALQYSIEALDIKFHHTRLAPYWAGSELACSAAFDSLWSLWCLHFGDWTTIGSLGSLELQDVMQTQQSVAPGLSDGQHQPRERTDSNASQSFAAQCDRLLREKLVVKGIANSDGLHDEWVVPATARVGDNILFASWNDANGGADDGGLQILPWTLLLSYGLDQPLGLSWS